MQNVYEKRRVQSGKEESDSKNSLLKRVPLYAYTLTMRLKNIVERKTSDTVQMLIQEVCATFITDYIEGKINRQEAYEWMNEEDSMEFISIGLRVPVSKLLLLIEAEMDVRDIEASLRKTLAI